MARSDRPGTRISGTADDDPGGTELRHPADDLHRPRSSTMISRSLSGAFRSKILVTCGPVLSAWLLYALLNALTFFLGTQLGQWYPSVFMFWLLVVTLSGMTLRLLLRCRIRSALLVACSLWLFMTKLFFPPNFYAYGLSSIGGNKEFLRELNEWIEKQDLCEGGVLVTSSEMPEFLKAKFGYEPVFQTWVARTDPRWKNTESPYSPRDLIHGSVAFAFGYIPEDVLGTQLDDNSYVYFYER